MPERSSRKAPARPAAGSGPRSLGDVARRLSRWSANLLATGLILMAGLVFGRQVLDWWQADGGSQVPGAVVDVLGPGVSGESVPRWLEFGDMAGSLARSRVAGDVETALAELRRTARSLVERGAPSLAAGHEGAPHRAERRLRTAVSRLEPVETLRGRGAVYQAREPFPMVVGVADRGQPAARVVSWGIALPDGDGTTAVPPRWTLFTYSAAPRPGGEDPLFSLPVPPGGRRTMSVRSDQAEQLMGVTGSGSLDEWAAFYDTRLAADGWLAAGPWRTGTHSRYRRYEHAARGHGRVQLVAQGRALHGVLRFEPRPPAPR